MGLLGIPSPIPWYRWLLAIPWVAVFWWKKRTGWLDLGRIIEVSGVVVTIKTARDGDAYFNVAPDPGQEWCITGFGGRLTRERSDAPPSIHCEIVPWSPNYLRAQFRDLALGSRVRVRGRWGFDGVHVGYRWYLWELLAALVRHQPNVRAGWFEIHPVHALELIPPPAPVPTLGTTMPSVGTGTGAGAG